jgi:hypothetical protein
MVSFLSLSYILPFYNLTHISLSIQKLLFSSENWNVHILFHAEKNWSLILIIVWWGRRVWYFSHKSKFIWSIFNVTFNNISVISWQLVLLVEKTRGPGENHRPVTSHRQTWSHNVVHLDLIETRTHNITVVRIVQKIGA